MWAAGRARTRRSFALDIEFHRRVLASSGNEMFLKLHELVAEVLTGATYGLMPHHPDEEALQLHADVASAIQRHDGERAREAMLRIMGQAMVEMKTLWAQTGAPPPDRMRAARTAASGCGSAGAAGSAARASPPRAGGRAGTQGR